MRRAIVSRRLSEAFCECCHGSSNRCAVSQFYFHQVVLKRALSGPLLAGFWIVMRVVSAIFVVLGAAWVCGWLFFGLEFLVAPGWLAVVIVVGALLLVARFVRQLLKCQVPVSEFLGWKHVTLGPGVLVDEPRRRKVMFCLGVPEVGHAHVVLCCFEKRVGSGEGSLRSYTVALPPGQGLDLVGELLEPVARFSLALELNSASHAGERAFLLGLPEEYRESASSSESPLTCAAPARGVLLRSESEIFVLRLSEDGKYAGVTHHHEYSAVVSALAEEFGAAWRGVEGLSGYRTTS